MLIPLSRWLAALLVDLVFMTLILPESYSLFNHNVQADCLRVECGIMLAGETIAARSRITGIEKARRFVQHGMLDIIDERTTSNLGRHRYPDVVAGYILYLKQFYLDIHYREIARIIERKCGHRSHHFTVKRFLDRHPIRSSSRCR